MTPEAAVKKLIAEIRADRKQRAEDLRAFCDEIGRQLTAFRGDAKDLRDEVIGLKLVLNDTRDELKAARSDIEQQAGNLRMLSDFTGMTEKKAGNGHRGKR